MPRREFLLGSFATMLLDTSVNPRIALSTWSLHPYFQATYKKVPGRPPQKAGKYLTLTEFFPLAKSHWGVTNFEIVNVHLDSRESRYLAMVKRAIADVGGRIVNMPCDIDEDDLSSEGEPTRARSVAHGKEWIDLAVTMESPSVRFQTGDHSVAQAVKSYRELAAYGAKKKIAVLIENDAGLSADPAKVVQVVEGVNSPNLGTCPDFGNGFTSEAARREGLKRMFPYAKICHAKTLEFDRHGNMTSFDFAACVGLAKASGFTGVYSVEFEGTGDPMQGVTWTIALLNPLLKAAPA